MNHNRLRSAQAALAIVGVLAFTATAPAAMVRRLRTAPGDAPVEALLYSTMASTWAHRATMAMDGDENTSFQTTGGMDDGDDFWVLLSRPIRVDSIKIVTGDSDGSDPLTNAMVETSPDGARYTKAATFDKSGLAFASLHGAFVTVLRIRTNPRTGVLKLAIREISIQSRTPITHVQYGPGRGFVDISQAPDLVDWSTRAEKQMESFWPDTDAMLYSYGFVPPNAVNVIYKTGPRVTGVAATGGGVMTVNSRWCRAHADDTGLTVHETAHVVQSIQASAPGWLIEGTADYIRWVKFEPEHFHPRINVNRATYHDAYQTTATFLGWVAIHYDSTIVTKLNDAARKGTYKNALFTQYCGKDVDALWGEFIAAYKADPTHILQPPMPAAMAPRELPTVTLGTCSSVNIAGQFDITGITADGASFGENGGFDGGGAAYSRATLGRAITTKAGVVFTLGADGTHNVIACHGNVVALSGAASRSLWILASSIEGSHKDQDITVTYADGSTKHFAQNFSDWYVPESFPGETRAVRVTYRNMADGSRDGRTFYVYSYGFSLDAGKTLKSVTLPSDDGVRVLAVTVAN